MAISYLNIGWWHRNQDTVRGDGTSLVASNQSHRVDTRYMANNDLYWNCNRSYRANQIIYIYIYIYMHICIYIFILNLIDFKCSHLNNFQQTNSGSLPSSRCPCIQLSLVAENRNNTTCSIQLLIQWPIK